MAHSTNRAFEHLNLYFGDIHNHCDLSYGHGSLEDALANARMQLDFASVTIHAVWPDLPTDDPTLAYLVDYHRDGFTKAKASWNTYLSQMEHANSKGKFITFPSFEWHSITYGDYCVYYKQSADSPIIDAPDLPTLRTELQALDTPALLIPHHIGYKQGSRGINWREFTNDLSPVAEIFSFHGLSESSEGPYPYLHSMGPRHEHSTAQFGWEQGNVFGIIGSTDHHNAFPGSYGYGRMGVWADALTRDSLWDAIQKRRTYALTGDRITLAYAINDTLMGGVCSPDNDRAIDVSVTAGDSIDYIEVLHNNHIIHRENVLRQHGHQGPYKIYIEMGWGEQSEPFEWSIDVQIVNGRFLSIEPRLRGYSPTATPIDDHFVVNELVQLDDHHMQFSTRTRQNLSLHTASTEGFALEIEGTDDTVLTAIVNGAAQQLSIGDLRTGSRTFYTGGFVSPAICFHRAVPQVEYQHRFSMSHHHQSDNRDWYYVRVRQRNNQWAWGSPIWITGMKS